MLHDFGRDVVFGLGEKDVDVVGDGVDLQQRAIVVMQDAGDIGMEFATFFVAEQRAAAFGAEDDVDGDDEQRLAHGALVVWIIGVCVYRFAFMGRDAI